MFFFFFWQRFFFFFFRFSFLRGHRILNIHIILNYISENESKLVRDPTLVLYNEKRFFFFPFGFKSQFGELQVFHYDQHPRTQSPQKK